jgi:transposase
MAYKRMSAMEFYEIVSRWHAGYNVSQISKARGGDRKTVRNYINLAKRAGLSREQPLPEKDELLEQLQTLLPQKEYDQPARSVFLPYKDEIIQLVADKQEPLKPKTAYEVICERHGITASYTSFKRALREHAAELQQKPTTTCRFETAPGDEVQIDYGKMGRLYDPLLHRNRDVFAFIATLSFSRLKFVEFVYKQDQRSFVGSHLRLFEFFAGVPKRLVIDNLKAGVIKADLYTPEFNRAYREMAEHYGCFIDPARPRHPKDKGKVERAVPLVRELFRKLKALHLELDIARANKEARNWCRNINGMREHSTTGLKPLEAFDEFEKDKLMPLPLEHFETPTWKEAKVHADQFIQFEKNFYSVPHVYVGKDVWVRATEKLIHIYLDHTLIKKHVRAQTRRQYDSKDFPKNFEIMLEDQNVQAIIERAEQIGQPFKKLLLQVLAPHAKLNYRRALALLRLKDKYAKEQLNQAAKLAIVHKIHTPKTFETLLHKIDAQQDEQPLFISEETRAMMRNSDYFIH